MGLDDDPDTNYYGLEPSHTAFDFGNSPGPLGRRSGFLFAGLGLVGLVVWLRAEL
jgi:hypothetical protein